MADDIGWSKESLLSAVNDDAAVTVSFNNTTDVCRVPRSVLFNASAWFRAALAPGRFKEGDSKAIKLSEANPVAFSHFVYWLFNKRLLPIENTSRETENEYTLILVQLWIIGDAYIVPALSNAALRLLHAYARDKWIGVESLKESFTRAPASHLSKFMMEEFVYALRMGEITESADPVEGGYWVYCADDVDALAMIPGVMLALCDRVRGPYSYHHDNTEAAAEGKSIEEFLVEEAV